MNSAKFRAMTANMSCSFLSRLPSCFPSCTRLPSVCVPWGWGSCSAFVSCFFLFTFQFGKFQRRPFGPVALSSAASRLASPSEVRAISVHVLYFELSLLIQELLFGLWLRIWSRELLLPSTPRHRHRGSEDAPAGGCTRYLPLLNLADEPLVKSKAQGIGKKNGGRRDFPSRRW